MKAHVRVRLRKQDRAAELLAQGNLTQHQVAAEIDVSGRTVESWVAKPEFQAKVETARQAIRDAIRAEGIANKQNRIDAYNERWRLLQQVIAERAADESLEGVPGGSTGMIIRDYKQVGSGRDAQLVVVYAVDTSTPAELRATEKQAAQELGQWVEKSEYSGETAILGLVGIKIEDL